MKSLLEKIHESLSFEAYSIDEAIDLSNYKSLWASKLEAKQIQDKLQIFFASYKGKVSLTNKTDRYKFFKAFVDTLTFGSTEENLRILKNYGMATDEGFASVILGNQKEFEEHKWNTSCIKNFDLSEIEKEYQKYKSSSDYVAGLKGDDVDENEVDERDLIIYDRWNPEIFEVFPFKGKRNKRTEHQVNMNRMTFHYDCGVKYYDCYPILANNYFGHLEDLKKRAEIGLMDQEAYQVI